MHSVPRTESIHPVGPSSEFHDTSDSLVESRLQNAYGLKVWTEITPRRPLYIRYKMRAVR
jgi:hypothetical protein